MDMTPDLPAIRSKRSSINLEYREAFPAWFRSLPLEERRRLEAAGITGPLSDSPQESGQGCSAEDLAGVEAEENTKEEDYRAAYGYAEEVSPEAAAEIRRECLAAVFSRVRAQGNPLLYLDALLSVLRVSDVERLTCEELAERHGVSKQRFAFLRSRIVETFNLPPPPGGRSIYKRKASKPRDPVSPWVRYTSPLDNFRRWWETVTGDSPVTSWDPHRRAVVRQELRWFAGRYVELGGSLEDLEEGPC